MTPCPWSCEVEDLALGILSPERALRASTHTRRCASCAAAFARIECERALVRRRAEAMPPMPADLADVMERVRRARSRRLQRLRSAALSATAVLAAAAGILLGVQARSPVAWPSGIAAETAAFSSSPFEPAAPEPTAGCVPSSCLHGSWFDCEPVTCTEPVTLAAHSGGGACSELPWLEEEGCALQTRQ